MPQDLDQSPAQPFFLEAVGPTLGAQKNYNISLGAIANANTVLAGPVSGPPNTTTFRPLIAADIGSPGGVSSFLRADGQWVPPPGSGGSAPGGATGSLQYNLGGGSLGGFGSWNFAPTVPKVDAGGVGPGLAISFTNPAADNNANDCVALKYGVTFDMSSGNPGFGDRNGLEINTNVWHGHNFYGAFNQSKTTFIGLNVGSTFYGAGQKNVTTFTNTSYGMGDCSIGQKFVNFSSGPIIGDEGQGYSLVSQCAQNTYLPRATISSVTRSAIAAGITSTNNITGATNPQTILVSATTGISVGDWLVIGAHPPQAEISMEAVLVTAVNPGVSITASIAQNHNAGDHIEAALVLHMNSPDVFQMGQQRTLINETRPAVTAGTVSAISGGGMDGSGTAWATNMVGGTVNNIGAICLAADYYTGSPYSGAGASGTAGCDGLDSWYLVAGISSTTHLSIFTYSVAGDQAYHGIWASTGVSKNYTIRQAVRILRLLSLDGVLQNAVICEPSSMTWNVNDTVYCPVCPYPDVSGYQDAIGVYTPGGSGIRAYLSVLNNGPRWMSTGIGLGSRMPTTGNSDYPVAFAKGISIGNVATGIVISDLSNDQIPNRPFAFEGPSTQTAAIAMGNAFFGSPHGTGRISWGTNNAAPYLEANVANGGMSFDMGFGNSQFNYIAPSSGINPSASIGEFQMQGSVRLEGTGNVADPTLEFGQRGGNSSAASVWARVVSLLIAGGPGGLLGQHFGFDFISSDGVDPQLNLLSMGNFAAGGPGIALPPAGTAVSNVTNKNAGVCNLYTSVWTGSVAALRPAIMSAVPGSGVDNAPLTWKLSFLDAAGSYAANFPTEALTITEKGVLFFGQNDTGVYYTPFGITMDPSNATAIRTVKWPDTAGDVVVATTNTTGAGSAALGANSPAITNTAPYTWLKMLSHDGSTVYVPAWK